MRKKALSTGWVEDQATVNVFEQFMKKIDQLEQRLDKLEKEVKKLRKTVRSLEEDVDYALRRVHDIAGPG